MCGCYNSMISQGGQRKDNKSIMHILRISKGIFCHFCMTHHVILQLRAAAVSSAQLYWVMNSPVKALTATASPSRKR